MNRESKGRPTGGQFAKSKSPESMVDLSTIEDEKPLVLGDPNSRPRGRGETAYGSKYDRNLGVTEISQRLRSEIKALVARGDLPTNAEIRVTSDKFAGGGSINIAVENWPDATVPEGTDPCDERYCQPGRRHDWRCPAAARPSDEAIRVQGVLQSLHDSYNYDGSDPMSDYFNTNYYGQVKIAEYRPPVVTPGLNPLSKTGSLADLKRKVTVGTVLESVQHPHYPAMVGVQRQVTKAKSNQFAPCTPKRFDRTGQNQDDFDSWVSWERASSVVYDVERGEFSIGDMRFRIIESQGHADEP